MRPPTQPSSLAHHRANGAPSRRITSGSPIGSSASSAGASSSACVSSSISCTWLAGSPAPAALSVACQGPSSPQRPSQTAKPQCDTSSGPSKWWPGLAPGLAPELAMPITASSEAKRQCRHEMMNNATVCSGLQAVEALQGLAAGNRPPRLWPVVDDVVGISVIRERSLTTPGGSIASPPVRVAHASPPPIQHRPSARGSQALYMAIHLPQQPKKPKHRE